MSGKKPSGYTSQYYDGSNNQLSTEIGNIFTWNQSEKIKSGHGLEKFILEDAQTQGINIYENIILLTGLELDGLSKPCLINKLKVSKQLYEGSGLKCKNKRYNEIDFCYLKEEEDAYLKTDLYEVKNGCDFDTKKSKGEIHSLTSSTELFKKLGFSSVTASIVCYDAKNLSDISIKTDIESVKLLKYEDMVTEIDMVDTTETTSRNRIDKKKQLRAKSRLQTFFEKINSIILNGWSNISITQKSLLYDKLMSDEEFMEYRETL
tara:strand:- start:1250 stop:2038 length:789 start_codon:yes stop_codon:yes gene_type:complete